MRPHLASRAITALGLLAGAWAIRHATSRAVQGWRPGVGRTVAAGSLQARVFGAGDPVVLLLHGMAADGNCFGAAFDELGRRGTVVVPDLLGFGASRGASAPFTAAGHLDALDGMLDALNLLGRPVVVAGHSMGGVLALCWGARHPATARAVVTFCAPLYLTPAEATEGLRRIGRIHARLTGDATLPEALCGWMCRFRAAAAWLSVALRPDLPVPVARSAVLHTWASYRGSLDGLLCDAVWEPALQKLAAAGVPVTLAEAACDRVPVPGRAAELAAGSPSVRHEVRPNTRHGLPLTDGAWCASLIGAGGQLR